jgi:hypothetical protein
MKTMVNLFDRLLPALLLASSVTLLTAGLLSYAPSAFGDWQTPEPELDGDPLLTPSPDPGATVPPTRGPGQTDPPATGLGFATRIRIPSLHIDLPVAACSRRS